MSPLELLLPADCSDELPLVVVVLVVLFVVAGVDVAAVPLAPLLDTEGGMFDCGVWGFAEGGPHGVPGVGCRKGWLT